MHSQRIAFASLAVFILIASPVAATDEEFAGPFPSWANVRRDYGAKGDGQADDGFRGDFALTTGLLMPVNSKHPASVRLRGRGDGCHVLCLGNLFWAPDRMVKADAVWKNEAKPPADAALLLCNMNGQVQGAKDSAFEKGGFGRLEDQKSSDDVALIRKVLAPLREGRIWLPERTREGVTDLRLYRVMVGAGQGGRCVVLQAGPVMKP